MLQIKQPAATPRNRSSWKRPFDDHKNLDLPPLPDFLQQQIIQRTGPFRRLPKLTLTD